MQWQTATASIDLTDAKFLGILNITPDSFSDGGRFVAPAIALQQADRLMADGAALLDIGAESTRPGAGAISPGEEWSRLEPVLEGLCQRLPSQAAISLDTRHAATAARGLEKGVAVLNDVTGFSDPDMLELARTSTCGLIAMRSRKRDGALWMPPYEEAGQETPAQAIAELKQVKDRLLAAGIAPERILLDPGFGFGTTFSEDTAIWNALPLLPEALAWPVERFCIGVSRKRFLAWRAGSPSLPPAERDDLTQSAHDEAMAMGYRVFRTHRINDRARRSAL